MGCIGLKPVQRCSHYVSSPYPNEVKSPQSSEGFCCWAAEPEGGGWIGRTPPPPEGGGAEMPHPAAPEGGGGRMPPPADPAEHSGRRDRQLVKESKKGCKSSVLASNPRKQGGTVKL